MYFMQDRKLVKKGLVEMGDYIHQSKFFNMRAVTREDLEFKDSLMDALDAFVSSGEPLVEIEFKQCSFSGSYLNGLIRETIMSNEKYFGIISYKHKDNIMLTYGYYLGEDKSMGRTYTSWVKRLEDEGLDVESWMNTKEKKAQA